MSLTQEKLAQAAALVQETGMDVWLTFVRETAGGSDPVLPLILDGGLTWQSALMVTRDGRKIAVVGNYDADPLKASGDWDEVIPYVQSIRGPLIDVLERACDEVPRIAVNFSPNDVKADGLTHGMYLLLQSYLEGTRFEGALKSAEPIVGPLRGVKSATERARIQAAILEGDSIFDQIPYWVKPGITERALYDRIHQAMHERGLGFAWDPTGDPIVNFGPDSMIGHGIPSESLTLEEGHVLHIDLGVIAQGYSSDIQRCWFVGEEVPSEVVHALDAVNAAITAGAEALKPGVLGHEVDAAARSSIVASGYPEYMHALGHQVGRVAHDGGSILGPQWERYLNTPNVPIREGEIYTLELGVTLEAHGYIGIEEMVVVNADGCEFLSQRQLEMPTLSLNT